MSARIVAIFRGSRSLAGRHRLLASLFAVATVLRLFAVLAYSPVLWYNDAFEYVFVAVHTTPYAERPDGYSFALKLLEPFHSLVLVVVLQHILGLALGVLIYALARRFRAPAWLGCLAAAPILFDAYEIQLEHMPLSDTLFTFLLLVAVAVCLDRPRLGWRAAVVVGLLAAAATLTRPAGLPVVVVLGIYLLVRRVGWRSISGFVAAFALPLIMYATWYHSDHGTFAIDDSTGIQLYGRVGGFADCRKMNPPRDLLVLCPAIPGNGLPAPSWVWHDSPLTRLPGFTFTAENEKLARSFAIRAILAQPVDYARAVGVDVGRMFSWDRGNYPNAYTVRGYAFDTTPPAVPKGNFATIGVVRNALVAYERGSPDTKVSQPWADILHWYQRAVYVRGTFLAAMFLLALVGLLPRSRGRAGMSRRPLILLLATSACLAFGPILSVQLDYRYVMPTLAFLPLAAALAGLRLWRSYSLPGGSVSPARLDPGSRRA